MSETPKLTKLHFDRAMATLRGLCDLPPVWDGETTSFHKRDQPYMAFQQRFRIENTTGLLGAPVELVGSMFLNKERDRIGLSAVLRAATAQASTTVPRPCLYGTYDVYEGQWNLRWT